MKGTHKCGFCKQTLFHIPVHLDVGHLGDNLVGEVNPLVSSGPEIQDLTLGFGKLEVVIFIGPGSVARTAPLGDFIGRK